MINYLLSLSICIIGISSYLHPDDFTCLDDSERAKIYFMNNASKLVPDLPQIRVQMCGYSSQCALEYAAFMFMREKLGINVTFYPTNDPDDGWSSQVDDPNVDDDPGYPENYFWWLKNDHNDINFEFWSGQEQVGNGLDYMLSGSVDFGGFVGAYGEESFFIPTYLVEEYPKIVVPYELKTNPLFRELLINGSAFGGTDYIQMYNESDFFDAPSYDIPTIWGSWPSYMMSRYGKNLTNNLHGGLNVSFSAIGSETNVKNIVQDLYTKRLAFMAMIYTVDDNFGVIDTNTSELQQFEKMAFPRNPDQSPYDPCMLAAVCQYNVSPLMKAANPLLSIRFPEAYDFFVGFSMATTQLNRLVSKYLAVTDLNISTSEKWLNASCEWLRDPESFSTWNVSSWLINIERYDCLEGCGINGEGGSCNYYTGTCECNYDELFADTDCKESCPGLLGPFNNDTSDDGDTYFQWCSGHGICDTMTRLCSCNLGYGDNGCSTQYTKYSLSVGLQVVIIFLSCLLSLICILCIIWLRINSQYKTVKALSVDMTTIMTVGLLMITCSNISSTQIISSASCISWQWLFGLGGILSIMSPLLKAYRVSRVFHGGKMLRAVKITDKMLMATLIKCAIIEVLICSAYTFLHEYFGGSILYYNDDELVIEDQCNDNSTTGYISMGSYAYFFVMLCALTKYSYGTRRALSVFKESTCAYFSSFLSLLCTLIVMVFFMATSDPTFRTSIQSFAIILVVSAVLSLFYGTRIYTFFTEPENRNVTDMSAKQTNTSHSNTSFTNSVMKPGPNNNDNNKGEGN